MKLSQTLRHPDDRTTLLWLLGFAIVYKCILLPFYAFFDSGYSMIIYENFFSDYQAVSYGSNYYLTNFIAAVFLPLFSSCQWIGMRILQIINDCLLLYGIFLIFRGRIPNLAILLGGIITMLNFVYRPLIFYYDSLTMTMAVYGILFLLRSYEKSSLMYAFWCGLTLGCAIFARIPNISYISLLPFAAAVFIITGYKWTEALKLCMTAICGYIIGILSILALVWADGHWDSFVGAFVSLSQDSGDAGDTHSVAAMLSMIIHNMYRVGMCCLSFLAGLTLLFYPGIRNRVPEKWQIALSLCAIIALCIPFAVYTSFYRNMIFSLYGQAFACYMIFLFFGWKHPLCILYTILLGAAILIPVGSDYYIQTVGYYALYLTAPLCVAACMQLYKKYHVGRSGVAALSLFLLYMPASAFYENLTQIIKCDTAISAPKMNGMLVEKERAAQLETQLSLLKDYSDPTKPLLVSKPVDLVATVLADRTPYNIRPYPWNSKSKILKNLNDMYQQKHILPDIFLYNDTESDAPERIFISQHSLDYRLAYQQPGIHGILLYTANN